MKKTVTLIFALMFFSVSIYASVRADSLLKSLQNKFNSLKDFSAYFIQTSNGKVNLSGRLFYKKKDKLRIEFRNVIIISNGKTNWNYNKKQNKTIISSYDSTNPSIYSINNFINNFPNRCYIREKEQNKKTILILTPKKNDLNFKEVKIWLTGSDLIGEIEVLDANNITMSIKFSHIKLNEGLPDSYFSFNPPEGSNIIDLR